MERFENQKAPEPDEVPEWVGPSAELLPKPPRRKRRDAGERIAAVPSEPRNDKTVDAGNGTCGENERREDEK